MFFEQFPRAATEKRMVVILPESRYADWLDGAFGGYGEFLVPLPAEFLVAESANGGH